MADEISTEPPVVVVQEEEEVVETPFVSSLPFELPRLSFSASSWGPSAGSSQGTSQFSGLPYASFRCVCVWRARVCVCVCAAFWPIPKGAPPFPSPNPPPHSRSDRLGKCSDFGGFSRFQQRACGMGGRRRRPPIHPPRTPHSPTSITSPTGGRFDRRGEENVELTYKFDTEEAREYALVDTTKLPRKGGMRPNQKRGGRGGAGSAVGGAGTRGYDDRGALAGGRAGNRLGDAINRKRRGGGVVGGRPATGMLINVGGVNVRRREPSVKVAADWMPLEVVPLAELSKLSTPAPTPVDLQWAGSLSSFDDEIDRISSKVPRKLKGTDASDFFFVSAKDDPVLQEAAQNDVGDVFVTDTVLSHLMAASRTVTPWDIVITYLPGGIIFLDSRDALEFELHTVNETAHVPPVEDPEDINGQSQLSIEATTIHQNVTQQVRVERRGEGGGDAAAPAPNRRCGVRRPSFSPPLLTPGPDRQRVVVVPHGGTCAWGGCRA